MVFPRLLIATKSARSQNTVVNNLTIISKRRLCQKHLSTFYGACRNLKYISIFTRLKGWSYQSNRIRDKLSQKIIFTADGLRKDHRPAWELITSIVFIRIDRFGLREYD